MRILDELRGNPFEKLKKDELTAERILQERDEALKIAELDRLSAQKKELFDKGSSAGGGDRRAHEKQIQQLDQQIKMSNIHLKEISDHIRILDNLIFIQDNMKMLEKEGFMLRLVKMPKSKLDEFLGEVNLKDQIMNGNIQKMLISMEVEYSLLGDIIEKIIILIRMSRPQGMISPLCACFAGIYLANMGFPSSIEIISSFILIILVWFGGVILNDYYDYEVDSLTEAHCLISSGRISRSYVLFASIFLMSTAFLLSLFISIKLSIIIGIGIPLIVLYNSKFKKMGLIGSFCFGIIEGLSFAIGVLVIGTFNQTLLYLIISIIFLHTSVNMIGAIKDIEADKKTGNWTVPAKYGINVTVQLAIFFLLLSSIMAYIPGRLNLLNLRYMPILIIINLWLIIITIMLKNENRLGYMALGMYEMGACIYYISFIAGI